MTGAALVRVRMEVAAGVPPTTAGLDGRSQRALSLATSVGAPVGPALAAAAAAAEDAQELVRAVHVATAQARLVARGLVVLPLLLVPALDVLLDLPLLGFYGTAAGRAVGAIGAALIAGGALVARGLIRSIARSTGRPGPDDEAADLVAAAVSAGLPGASALRAVGEVRPDLSAALAAAALAMERGQPSPSSDARIAEAVGLLEMADGLGVPVAAALGDLARRQRADERARIRARAEQLPGLLTVPSVLLLLPATVLLVGAPIVGAGLRAL